MATQDEGVGADFDPIQLATSVMDTVSAHLSDCGRFPELLVTSPEELGAGQGGESRLNCFYRLLGFPATREEPKIVQRPETIIGGQTSFFDFVTQGDTLNYVTKGAIGARFSEAIAAAAERAAFSGKKQTPADYAIMIQDPLAISSSLTATGRRPVLFPPIVDASVSVFPLAHRVAPLFNNGDFLISGGRRRLSRPFIEHAIYMRTKVFSGGAEATLVKQISDLIKKQTGDEALAAQLPGQFTQVEKSIVEKFIQALRQSAKGYAVSLGLAKKLQSEVAFEAAPVNNPNQRSISPLSSDPTIGVTITSLGAKIQELSKELARQQSFMISLPTEAVNRADRIRRIEDEIALSNVKADVFVSEFVDLLGFERSRLEAEMAELKQEERAKITQVEQVKRDLMFYTGEFTGLSIFDILCTFYGIFTVELKFLIGLLNEGAKDRLKKDPFFKTNQIGTGLQQDSSAATLIDASATLEESLEKFQSQVEAGFRLAEFFFSEASSDG